MKRVFALLLILATVLSGCASTPAGTPVAKNGLRLTLPGEFLDLSAEDYAVNADFCYGAFTLVVSGLCEDKYFWKDGTLSEYTDLLRSGNGITAPAEEFARGYRFSYEAPIGGELYSYTVATVETSTHFWIIQCFCPADNAAENAPIIEEILASVKTE